MIRARTIRRRLRLLMKGEEGIALPVALFTTIAAMALGGVAVMSSIDVQSGATRDNGAKSAIAAADAGANVAEQRLNSYASELSEEKPCLNENSGGKLEPGPAPSGGKPGWCAPIEGEEVGGASYSYWISAIGKASEAGCDRDACIVSTGTANEVSRRVELSLGKVSFGNSLTHQELIQKMEELLQEEELNEQETKQLEEELQQAIEEESHGGFVPGLAGKNEITISGNGDVRVGVGTNGNLVTSGNASICGDIQVGEGKSWKKSGNASQCSGYTVTQGTTTLPEVSSFIPSDIATNNSDYRLVKCTKTSEPRSPSGCQSDTYSGTWSSTTPWNPSTRAISLSGNTTLTIGGGDYWICSLSLSGNSQLIMAAGAHARFFFDTPEHCGTTTQINMSGNNKITASGYQPSQGQFDMPGFYLLGSPTEASQVNISGNASTTDEFVIYGPNTTINISGNATFKGIVAGKSIAMSGNGTIEQDPGFEAPPEITPPSDSGGAAGVEERQNQNKSEHESLEEQIESLQGELESEPESVSFQKADYVQCTGTVSSGQPNANC
jgi:hypothetical protein